MATDEEIRAKDVIPKITEFREGDGLYGDGPTSFFMEYLALLKQTSRAALAGNLAPEFYETRQYAPGDSVIRNGKYYTFIVPHMGPWDESDVNDQYSLSQFAFKQINNLPSNRLSDIERMGYYKFSLQEADSLVDLPNDYGTGAGLLLVYRSNTTVGIFTQILIKTSGNRIYKRFVDHHENVVEPWIPVSNFIYNGNAVSTFNYTTLKQCKEYGIYNAKHNEISTITDLPSDYGESGGCTLVVMPNNPSNNLQLLYKLDGNIWQRYSPVSGEGDAGGWTRISPSFSVRGNLVGGLGYTALKSCTQPGVYTASATDCSSITDLPGDFGQSRSITLTVSPSNTTYNLQILNVLDGRVWQRYSPVSGEGDAGSWTLLTPNLAYKTKVAALGDSITQGYWSDSEGTLHSPDAKANWPYYLGLLNNWDVTNYGLGGAGYVHKATISPYRDATEIVDNVNFADFDVVTLAFGVNDWHYSCEIGNIATSTVKDGTMVGNMRYCVEKILTINPKIKIVVIGPFNSSKYGGDFDSNWGLGSFLPTSGTLQNVVDQIMSVCSFYGLQYVDCINDNVVNRYNINEVLGDKLHPLKELYLPIAKSLSRQIMSSSKVADTSSVTYGVGAVTYADDSFTFGERAQTGMVNPDEDTNENYPYANIQYSIGTVGFTVSGNQYYGYRLDNGAEIDVDAFGQTTHVVNDTGVSCTLFAVSTQNCISDEYPNNLCYLVNDNTKTYINKCHVNKVIYPRDDTHVTVLVLVDIWGLPATITDSYIAMYFPTVDHTYTNSKGAIAFGDESLSVGKDSLSVGNGANAFSYQAGKNAIAIGAHSTSVDSLVLGPNNFAAGGYSYNIAIGNSCRSVNNGLVVGYASNVANSGIAVGTYTTAKYSNAIAIGNEANARSDYQIVLGRNETDATAAFIVGRNGTNLFKINPDGEVFIMKDGVLTSLHELLNISPQV